MARCGIRGGRHADIEDVYKCDEIAVEWPFTSNIIPDPIVDWNKLSIFDEEPIEEIMKSTKEEIIVVVSNETKNIEQRFVPVYIFGSVEPTRLVLISTQITSILKDFSLKFRFEKINLKYKMVADKRRRIKLFQAMETRGRGFFF